MKFSFITTVVSLAIITVNGNKTFFVQRLSDVTLHCCKAKSLGITWKRDQNATISINDTVNPEYKAKYEIVPHATSNRFDLRIKNFTDADQGEYLGSFAKDGLQQDCLFKLNVCDQPHEIELFRDIFNASITTSQQQHVNFVCQKMVKMEAHIKVDSILQTESFVSINTQAKQYKCITLIEGQCKLSGRRNVSLTFTNWEELDHPAGKELLSFVCVSKSDNKSGISNGSIKVFYTKDVFYLMDVAFETYECQINSFDFASSMEPSRSAYDIILASIICVVSVILVIVTVFAIVRGIKRKYKVPSTVNIPGTDENYIMQNENNETRHQEYSSDEGRQRINYDQNVTYSVCRPREDRCRGRLRNKESPLPELNTRQSAESREPNYIEVEILPCKLSHPSVRIADDARSPYADINFTQKADPLPEEESSYEEDND